MAGEGLPQVIMRLGNQIKIVRIIKRDTGFTGSVFRLIYVTNISMDRR